MGSVSVMAGLLLTAKRATNNRDEEEKCPEKSVIFLFLRGGTGRWERYRERERLRGRRRVAVGVGAKQRDGDNTKDDGGEKIQQGRGRETSEEGGRCLRQ